MSVSMRFLNELEDIPKHLRLSIAQFMGYIHGWFLFCSVFCVSGSRSSIIIRFNNIFKCGTVGSVGDISKIYLQNDRRYNYTTPKSFLELINLYVKIVTNKHEELASKIERLGNGLEKLRVTGAQVEELKAQLATQEVELQKKNEEADKLIEVVGIETEKVSKEKATADKEKLKVNEITKAVSIKQIDCAEDLKKAEPALLAAQDALNTLNKSNLTELKSFGSPPGAVINVTAAVMVLLSHNGKVPKDRSWAKAKVMMSKVDQFLDTLIKVSTAALIQ